MRGLRRASPGHPVSAETTDVTARQSRSRIDDSHENAQKAQTDNGLVLRVLCLVAAIIFARVERSNPRAALNPQGELRTLIIPGGFSIRIRGGTRIRVRVNLGPCWRALDKTTASSANPAAALIRVICG